MVTLYLHVGIPKTATTTLQHFLGKNRKKLLEYGVYYPETGMVNFAHHYLANSMSKVRLPVFHPKKGFGFYLADLKKEIGGNSIVLISSEFFSGELDYDKIKLFFEIADEVKIIVYVRRQDKFLESAYTHQVFNDGLKTDINTFYKDRIQFNTNYKEICDFWRDILGLDNLIVRVFEKCQFFKEDIIYDFLNIFSINTDQGFELPGKRLNVSLPRDEIEFKRLLNHFKLNPRIGRRINGLLLKRFYELKPVDFNCHYRYFTSEERKKILDRFEESNAYVADRILLRGNGRLFYEPVISESWEPYPELTTAKTNEILEIIIKQDKLTYGHLYLAAKSAMRSNDQKIRNAAYKLKLTVKYTWLKQFADKLRIILSIILIILSKPALIFSICSWENMRKLARGLKNEPLHVICNNFVKLMERS